MWGTLGYNIMKIECIQCGDKYDEEDMVEIFGIVGYIDLHCLHCAKLEIEDHLDEVQGELDSVNKAIKRYEKKHGKM